MIVTTVLEVRTTSDEISAGTTSLFHPCVALPAETRPAIISGIAFANGVVVPGRRASVTAAHESEVDVVILDHAAGSSAPPAAALLAMPTSHDIDVPFALPWAVFEKPVGAVNEVSPALAAAVPRPIDRRTAPDVAGVMLGELNVAAFVPVAVVAVTSIGVVASAPRQTWTTAMVPFPDVPEPLHATVVSGVVPMTFQSTERFASRVSFE